MEIIIDNRENNIIKILEEKEEFIKKNLDLGDIQYIQNDEIVYIVERKTFDDLGASIKDGRYKEQKMRLLSNNNDIYYILEGNIDKCKTINKKALLGSIVNMIFRDNIKVIFSENIEQTVEIIIQIKKKFNEGKFFKNKKDNEYVNSIKIKKKENMDKLTCNIIQLATIPGVSKNTAEIIIENYLTMDKLIEEYKINGSMLLKDLSLGKKKLGKVLSEKIYNYLI